MNNLPKDTIKLIAEYLHNSRNLYLTCSYLYEVSLIRPKHVDLYEIPDDYVQSEIIEKYNIVSLGIYSIARNIHYNIKYSSIKKLYLINLGLKIDVSQLVNLEELYLETITYIYGLGHLLNLKKLELNNLNMSNCKKYWILKNIKSPHLETIKIIESRLVTEIIASISHFRNIKSLNIDGFANSDMCNVENNILMNNILLNDNAIGLKKLKLKNIYSDLDNPITITALPNLEFLEIDVLNNNDMVNSNDEFYIYIDLIKYPMLKKIKLFGKIDLYYNKRRIEKFPSLPNVEYIDLAFTFTWPIQFDFSSEYPSVKILTLRENFIIVDQIIEPQFRNIESLDLRSSVNQVAKINLENCPKLKNVYLLNIVNIEENLLQNAHNIKSLNISSGIYCDIKLNVQQFRYLTFLYINGIHIGKNIISDLPFLEVLILVSNENDFLLIDFSNMQNLKKIDFRFSNLLIFSNRNNMRIQKNVSANKNVFPHLPNLQSMVLMYNNMYQYKIDIFNYPLLTYLELYGNIRIYGGKQLYNQQKLVKLNDEKKYNIFVNYIYTSTYNHESEIFFGQI